MSLGRHGTSELKQFDFHKQLIKNVQGNGVKV